MKLTPIKANMNEVEIGTKKVLFSYKTPVAYLDIETGKFHRTSKKWSQTTTKHINQWYVQLTNDSFNPLNSVDVDQSELDYLIK
jgi:hypothetical protein